MFKDRLPGVERCEGIFPAILHNVESLMLIVGIILRLGVDLSSALVIQRGWPRASLDDRGERGAGEGGGDGV